MRKNLNYKQMEIMKKEDLIIHIKYLQDKIKCLETLRGEKNGY